MTRIKTAHTVSEPVYDIGTHAAEDPVLSGSELNCRRDAWDQIIDRYLIEWARYPSRLDDEGVIPPSADIIHRACEIAIDMRDQTLAAPLRVVPNGDGGIVFERREGPIFQTIEIYEDGSVESAAFVDSRLVSCHRLV